MDRNKKLVILLKRLLSIPPTIQLYHWHTRSHARHLASGELYNKLIELNDECMEVFMGKYHRIKISSHATLPLRSLDGKNVLTFLKENITFFSHLETFLPELKSSTDLLSIRDLIVAELNKTLYLFTLR